MRSMEANISDSYEAMIIAYFTESAHFFVHRQSQIGGN